MAEKKYDYKSMTETEYMQNSWTLEELEAHFRDNTLGDIRREHAFFRFWSKWQNSQLEKEGFVSHEDLEKILEFSVWSGPAGQIIEELAIYDKLAPDDVEWLIQILPTLMPDRTHVRDQVIARSLLQRSSLDWISVLKEMLNLRADWAIYKLLGIMPTKHLEQAQEMIVSSSRPKNAKRRLLYEVALAIERKRP